MEAADGKTLSPLYAMSPTTGAHQSMARPNRGNASIIVHMNNNDKSLEAFVINIREDVALCDMLKQRRTRWLEEEEDYAKFLVREFDHGIARDVENNSTLRAYLSRKLICTPMRVSKKFVGKKVGTIFYKAKVVLPHIAEISAQTHLELEKKCLSALVIAIDRSKEAEQKLARPQVKLSTQQAVMSKSSHLNSVLHTVANPVPQQQCQFITHEKLECKQTGIPFDQHLYQSINRGDPAHINRSQNILHFHPCANNSYGLLQMRAPNNCTVPGRSVENGLGDPASCNGNDSIHSQAIVSVQDPLMNPQTGGASIKFKRIKTDSIYHSSARCNSSMIDLVSGFDKHAASLNAKRDITTVLESRPSSTTWPENSHFFDGTLVESPYITTKSFDELHRCLGKDIPHNPSHLDLNETKIQVSDNQTTILVDSPYITSKSFDEMHKCLGVGLSSSMSHIRLSNIDVSSESPNVGSSALAFSGSNFGVHLDGTATQDAADRRSDRSLSAFSPFDANRTIRNHETAPGRFDKLIHRAMAPDEDHRSFVMRHTSDKSKPSYVFDTHPYSSQTTQGFNMRMSYEAPFEYGLATFLQNNRDFSRYPQVVSTSASERSSDRCINSSPDCTDVQSD